eukprot:gene26618-biopygen17006
MSRGGCSRSESSWNRSRGNYQVLILPSDFQVRAKYFRVPTPL